MRADRLAMLHAATNREAGEVVRVLPQQGGGYTVGGIDPARPAQDITAIVTIIPAVSRVKGGGGDAGSNAALRAAADTVKFTTSDLDYAVQSGDLIGLTERAGAPLFKVSRAAPYGTGRTVLYLVPAVPV